MAMRYLLDFRICERRECLCVRVAFARRTRSDERSLDLCSASRSSFRRFLFCVGVSREFDGRSASVFFCCLLAEFELWF